MTMAYLPSRDDSEQTIQLLAERYPKCFFEDPRLRKPLKKNIVVDLQNDGIPVAYELLAPALDWYQTHFGYQYSLQAGAKRLDLNGNEAGTVTEQEQRAAEIKIKAGKQKLTEKNRNNAVETIRLLHAQGRIPTDQVKKLDAPPLQKPKEVPMKAKTTAPLPAPELEQVYTALAAASALMLEGRNTLHSAMAAAALGVVIQETQRAIDELQGK